MENECSMVSFWRDGNDWELQEEMAVAHGTILGTTELNIHETFE